MIGGEEPAIKILIDSVIVESHKTGPNDLYLVKFGFDKEEYNDKLKLVDNGQDNNPTIKKSAYKYKIGRENKEKNYDVSFENEYLKKLYEIINGKCTNTDGNCIITRSIDEKYIKFDMKSPIKKKSIKNGVDVFMKIENFGNDKAAMVSLHYSTDSSDENIKKLDDDEFYKHFIEDADKNYNFKSSAIKFIIALYVDSQQNEKSKMRIGYKGGRGSRGSSTRKLHK